MENEFTYLDYAVWFLNSEDHPEFDAYWADLTSEERYDFQMYHGIEK